MFEAILLSALAAALLLAFRTILHRGLTWWTAIDRADPNAELRPLSTREKRERDRKAQRRMFEAQAIRNAHNPFPTEPAPRPAAGVPDEIYLMDASMVGVSSGAAFRDFARTKYQSGHYPMPNSAQMGRIAAQIDAKANKRTDFVLIPPVAVIRKPRRTENATKGNASWFGGRPMLEAAPWPRTSQGLPMHHWASIDMRDLAEFDTAPGLPDHGKLAFFVNAVTSPFEGKVLFTPDEATQSEPPEDLPIVDHDSKFMFGSADYAKADAPTEYLHWDVEFMQLPPDRSKEEYAAAQQLVADRFPDTSSFNLHTHYLAKIHLDRSGTILWDSVRRYAEKILGMQTNFACAIEAAKTKYESGDSDAIETCDYLQMCLSELLTFVEKVREWAAPNDQWATLSAEDKDQLAKFRKWSLEEKDIADHRASYAVRATNQNVKSIADDIVATFHHLAEHRSQFDEILSQDIKLILEGYSEITEPFVWDTARRCAEKVTLADTYLGETLVAASKDAETSKNRATERLAYLQAHTTELRAYIRDFQQWVAPHNNWSPMGDTDRRQLHVFMSRLDRAKGSDFVLAEFYSHEKATIALHSLKDACNATLRTVARGEERLYKLLPQSLKDILDHTHRLPDRFGWHQMFGEGVSRQVAREEHPYDHLLLQLMPDHMMMGVWDGGGVVQFWISPEDLRLQNWDAVTVTVESD
jgi:hypothetical protein